MKYKGKSWSAVENDIWSWLSRPPTGQSHLTSPSSIFSIYKMGLTMSTSQGCLKPQMKQAVGPGSKNRNLNPKQICVHLFSPLLWTLELAKPTSLGCWRTKVMKCKSNTQHVLGTRHGSYHNDMKALQRFMGSHWTASNTLFLFCSPPHISFLLQAGCFRCPRAVASRENCSSDTALPLATHRRQ